MYLQGRGSQLAKPSRPNLLELILGYAVPRDDIKRLPLADADRTERIT